VSGNEDYLLRFVISHDEVHENHRKDYITNKNTNYVRIFDFTRNPKRKKNGGHHRQSV